MLTHTAQKIQLPQLRIVYHSKRKLTNPESSDYNDRDFNIESTVSNICFEKTRRYLHDSTHPIVIYNNEALLPSYWVSWNLVSVWAMYFIKTKLYLVRDDSQKGRVSWNSISQLALKDHILRKISKQCSSIFCHKNDDIEKLKSWKVIAMYECTQQML